MSRTRTIRHRDGKCEILRVLSTDDLLDWKGGGGSLGHERSIVWLQDIEQLPFVRVVEVKCAKSRRGRLILQGTDRVVGYSKLMADAPRDLHTGRFTRRLFYLKANDLAGTSVPPHSLDPRSILPGVAGEKASLRPDATATHS
jgi:hypothetical protein